MPLRYTREVRVLLLSLLFSLLPACANADADRAVLLYAGGPSHGPGEHEYFAGAQLLARFLEEQPGVDATVIRDWPDSATLDSAAALVVISDGNRNHPVLTDNRLAELGAQLNRGLGLVAIHWSVHVDASDTEEASYRVMLGGYYETDVSVNPIWTATIAELPEHPTTRGVAPFVLRDEWYYNIQFVSTGVTPILSAIPPEETRTTEDAARFPGRSETIAWAYQTPGEGRAFGITGAHFHESWASREFRRLVTNSVLWVAGTPVPERGARVPLSPGDLLENLD